jgi:hypothetical protein
MAKKVYMRRFKPHRLLLVLALVMFVTPSVSVSPSKACVCVGLELTERFYRDSTFTQQTGACVENLCNDSYQCTGAQTNFVRNFSRNIICNPDDCDVLRTR